MPAAVTHVLIAIILIDLLRKIILRKKEFPLYLVLIVGIAGLLPDLDVLVYWFLDLIAGVQISEVHRLFSHTLLIPFVLFVIAVGIWTFWTRFSHVLFGLSFGYTVHLVLDSLLSGKLALFYPLTIEAFGLNLIPGSILSGTFYTGLDAIILIIWLVYEYFCNNIKDYI
jgi:membrane-bound metal-dependent hydrolase YbcI (DUF457 family)